MADPKELANKARTTLAQGLDALQSHPDVPDELLAIAEPIAETMGLLHRIEKGGSADAALCKEALERTRNALDALQKVDSSLDAVDQAMEAVAGSLSKLFALSKAIDAVARQAPQPVQPAPQAMTQPVQAAVQPTVQAPMQPPMAMQQPPVPQPPWVQAAQPPLAQPPLAQPPMQPTIPQPAVPTPAPQLWGQAVHAPLAPAAPMQTAQAFAGTQPQIDPEDLKQTVAIPPKQQRDDHVTGTTDMPQPPTGARIIQVELGAHSSSNFYKGLSGNDVIDHGGIFVATYQIPKVGTPVALKMLLPGDLEFLADAVVQWTRETRGGETDPGFGAKFTRISPEGRQLVYRYVRNREPMFYDDM